MRTITVNDGYNGSTVQLDADEVLESMPGAVKLHVVGYPWLIRWVALDDINARSRSPSKATTPNPSQTDQTHDSNGPRSPN